MKQSKARGKVQLATARLATALPLHAGIIAQWRLVEDSSIATMAIGFQHGRLVLAFSPKFVESLSLDEIAAVLSHETNHVLLGHCSREPVANENKRAMTVAEEVTVNEWAVGPLPGEPILLADFPSLPPNESTEDRYQRLRSVIPDTVQTLDDHSRWEQLRGALSSAVVSTVIAQVWSGLTPDQKAKVNLPTAALKVVEQAARDASTLTVGGGESSVPWQQVLRRYVGRELRRRPVFGRVPRRLPHLVGIIPATSRSGSKPVIMAVIDTSGSMTASVLADISKELAVMTRTHKVLVVEADDKIRDVYPYRPIGSVKGRSGTDFRPALAPEFLQQHRPDLVVYFTDGRGKAPVDQPSLPVIWCLTVGGRQPCAWGRVVKMGCI